MNKKSDVFLIYDPNSGLYFQKMQYSWTKGSGAIFSDEKSKAKMMDEKSLRRTVLMLRGWSPFAFSKSEFLALRIIKVSGKTVAPMKTFYQELKKEFLEKTKNRKDESLSSTQFNLRYKINRW